MKEMKTQLILFSLLLLGSTAWAQQPCLSQDAYREKVEAYSQILKQQKLKTLASSEARKIAHTGFLPKIDVNADGTLNMSDLSAWNEPVGEYRNHTYQGVFVVSQPLYTGGALNAQHQIAKADEKLNLPMVVAGQRRSVSFVNEHGLYSILSQSRKEIARAWRRVVHDELINLRRTKGFDISEQFDEWNNAMDNIYFDEATGQLMQSVTTPGGDVEQVPYKG